MIKLGHVYVMRNGDGRMKVGMSRNPVRRATALGMSLLYSTEAIKDAPRIERIAHGILENDGVAEFKGREREMFRCSEWRAINAVLSAKNIIESGETPPKTSKTQKRSFSIRKTTLQRLDAWLAKQPLKVNVSSLADDAINQWLDRAEDDNETSS